MQEKTEFYSEFGYYIHQIVALLDKRGDELFRREVGISLRQFLLLRLFDTDDAALPSQQAIAQRLGIAKSAVSRHIDIARKQGWISVDTSATSRRQHTLTLTSAGKVTLAKAKEIIVRSEEQGFGDLPTADVEATVRTLKALYKKMI